MKWKLEDVATFAKARLSPKRFQHVLGVVETAEMLAKRHDVNVSDASYAAMIHDIAKEQDVNQIARLLRLENEHDYLQYSDKVWHAPLGAIIATKTFGIENQDIINAIKYHPTGRAQMSDLEKVLFVADYTEPNRNFEEAIAIREFWGDLERAVYEILKQKVERVTALKLNMHPDTLVAHNYYRQRIND